VILNFLRSDFIALTSIQDVQKFISAEDSLSKSSTELILSSYTLHNEFHN